MLKLRNKKGFSLSELLVATLILLMVTTVVAGGIPVAKNAYEKVTVSANSQAILSTIISELHARIGVADYIKVEDNKIYYQSGTTGGQTCIYSDDTDGIMIENFLKYGVEEGQSAVRLLSEKATPDNMYVTYDTVDWDNEHTVTFSNLIVHSELNDEQAKLDTLVIYASSINKAP